MNDQEVSQLYKDLWKHCGAQYQIDICIEEMAELTQAFLKARREKLIFNKNVYKELADVSICLDQIIKHLEDIEKEDEFLDAVDYKLERLKKRLIEKKSL
jgi:NTP pyrophosphatase (non-canonical NTP hydrolase)